MRQVIEQYASAIIASGIGILIIFLIGQNIYDQGIGINQVLGLILQDSIEEPSIVENGVMEAYVKESEMNIKEKNVYMLTNQEVKLSDCFEVTTQDGVLSSVYVQEVWNPEWKKMDAKLSADRTKICFLEKGIYWLQIYAMDKYEKKHNWIVKVLVNER